MTTFLFDALPPDESYLSDGKIYVDDGNGGAFQGNRTITIQRGTQYTFNTQTLEENSTNYNGYDSYLRIGTTTNGGEIDLAYHDADSNYVITFTPLNSTPNTLYYWVTETADSTNDRNTQYGYGVINVQGTINASPTISLTGASSIQMNQGETYNELGATASDTEDGDITSSIVITGDTFNTNVAGTYTVTYTITDSNNATASTTRTVEVIDLPPTLTLLGANPLNVRQGGTFTDPGATASDLTDGNITENIQVGGDTVDINTVGSYSITYSITDSVNQTVTLTRTVNVTLNNLPTINLTGANSIQINQGETYNEPGASASDTEDGDITSSIVVTGNTFNTNVPGTYTITYTVTDSNGGTASATRSVEVVDLPPTLTLLGDNPFEVIQRLTFTDPGATASDLTDGNITENIQVTGSVDTDTPGDYTLTYSITDSANNTVTTQRVVRVIENKLPTITLNGDNPFQINQGETFVDPGASANDDEDGVLSVTTSGSVNTSTPGTYTITYTATDQYGASSSITRSVEVIDLPPSLTLLGANPFEIIEGSTFTDPGATASDLTDGNITANIQVTGSVNNNTIGSYTLTYSITDSANQTVTLTRTVNVIENNLPTITLNGASSIQINQGETYTELGASASDIEDGVLSVSITGTVDINTPGTYTLTYTAQDNNGGSASTTRTVVVIDLPPTLTLLGSNPFEIIEGNDFIDPGASASDLTDGNITANIQVTGTVDTNTVGSYTLTYSITDSANQTVTRTRTVNVIEFLTTKMFIGYKIDNITLAALTEDNKNNIIDNIKKLYASQLNVDESKVEVILSEGSVLANITISLTGNINDNKSSIESTVVELERNKTRILNVFSEETGINNLLIDSNYENTELFVNDTNSPNLVSAGKPRTQPENLRHLRFLRGKRNSELNNNGKRDIVTSGVGARTASNRGAIARRSLGVTPFVKKFF